MVGLGQSEIHAKYDISTMLLCLCESLYKQILVLRIKLQKCQANISKYIFTIDRIDRSSKC